MTSTNGRGHVGFSYARDSENGAVPNDGVQVRDQLQRRRMKSARVTRRANGRVRRPSPCRGPASPHHHVRSRAAQGPAVGQARRPPGHRHRQAGQAFRAALLAALQVPPGMGTAPHGQGLPGHPHRPPGRHPPRTHPRGQGKRQPQFRHRLDRHCRHRLPRPQPHTKRAHPLRHTRRSSRADSNGQRQPHGGGRPQPSRDHVHHPAVPNLRAPAQSPDRQRPALTGAPACPDLAGRTNPSGTGTDPPTRLVPRHPQSRLCPLVGRRAMDRPHPAPLTGARPSTVRSQHPVRVAVRGAPNVQFWLTRRRAAPASRQIRLFAQGAMRNFYPSALTPGHLRGAPKTLEL